MITSEETEISGFTGRYQFLSNFHESPVTLDGSTYVTVEAAYQAAKTLDPELRTKIRLEETPGRAKRLGRKADMRPDWNSIRYGVMLELVRQKFVVHPDLARRLLDTGNATIVETNHWNDTTWGVCDGEGENWMGQILMAVRQELRQLQHEIS